MVDRVTDVESVEFAELVHKNAPAWMGHGAVEDIIASIRAQGTNPIKLAFDLGRLFEIQSNAPESGGDGG